MIKNYVIFKIYFIIFSKILTFKGQKRTFKKIEKIGEIGALPITEFGQTRACRRDRSLSKKAIWKDWSPMFSERWEPWIRRDWSTRQYTISSLFKMSLCDPGQLILYGRTKLNLSLIHI